MDTATLKRKIKEYDVFERELLGRLALAGSDRQRLEIERMLRLVQVTAMGFLSRAQGPGAKEKGPEGPRRKPRSKRRP